VGRNFGLGGRVGRALWESWGSRCGRMGGPLWAGTGHAVGGAGRAETRGPIRLPAWG
jgi:hypothetical protein